MSVLSEIVDIPELCLRLHREANAQAVVILGQEGEILGHAGSPGRLAEDVIDAVADATAETLDRAARIEQPTDNDDHVAQAGGVQVCAAALGRKAVLVVVFDDTSNLSLVRLRMKRARELILRNLDAT